jgi:hypothetical protein
VFNCNIELEFVVFKIAQSIRRLHYGTRSGGPTDFPTTGGFGKKVLF